MRGHQPGGSPVAGDLPQELRAFVGRSAEIAVLSGALGTAGGW
ncbi:hypothetical protein [Streptomyces dysideae]